MSFDSKNPREQEAKKMEREKALVRLFESEFDDEEHCIGYHGTSLEAIEYLIKNGGLPGNTMGGPGKLQNMPGTLNFFPIDERFQKQFAGKLVTLKEAGEDDPVHSIDKYAENAAFIHRALSILDLPISNPNFYSALLQLHGTLTAMVDRESKLKEDLASAAKITGKSKKEIMAAVNKAKARRGIVIGLHQKIIDSGLKIGLGDHDEGDLQIHLTAGLTPDLISGLDPLGKEELDFFLKLQKKYE